MSDEPLKALIALCRLRSQEAATPHMKGEWTNEANQLERDPSREGHVRVLLWRDPRLEAIPASATDTRQGGDA